MNPDDDVFKEIHLGSFFPDQQPYARISGSTKHAAGSFMNNDLRTPAAASPSEGNDEKWKCASKIYPIYSCSCRGHAPSLSSTHTCRQNPICSEKWNKEARLQCERCPLWSQFIPLSYPMMLMYLLSHCDFVSGLPVNTD